MYIINCTFQDSSSNSRPSSPMPTGIVYFCKNGNFLITDCKFKDTWYRKAIRVVSYYTSINNLLFENISTNRLKGNEIDGNYNFITNCIFKNGTAAGLCMAWNYICHWFLFRTTGHQFNFGVHISEQSHFLWSYIYSYVHGCITDCVFQGLSSLMGFSAVIEFDSYGGASKILIKEWTFRENAC